MVWVILTQRNGRYYVHFGWQATTHEAVTAIKYYALSGLLYELRKTKFQNNKMIMFLLFA